MLTKLRSAQKWILRCENFGVNCTCKEENSRTNAKSPLQCLWEKITDMKLFSLDGAVRHILGSAKPAFCKNLSKIWQSKEGVSLKIWKSNYQKMLLPGISNLEFGEPIFQIENKADLVYTKQHGPVGAIYLGEKLPSDRYRCEDLIFQTCNAILQRALIPEEVCVTEM